MPYNRRSSRTPRSRYTLGLLLLTAVSLLVLDLPGTGPLDPVRSVFSAAFRPIRAAGNAVFEPLSNGWHGAFHYGDVKDENDKLRKQLEDRKGQAARIAKLEQDKRDLEAALQIKAGTSPSKAAKVITGPITSFEQTIEIDVGSRDHIKKGMAVVTGGGVLGRIDKVKAGSSTVELITQSSFSIGVRTKKGDIAVAHGQGEGKALRVVGIEDATHLKVGDYLWTSGIDRTAFPGDLYIGKISKVGKSVDGFPRVIEVRPSADLSARYVRVVLKDPPK